LAIIIVRLGSTTLSKQIVVIVVLQSTNLIHVLRLSSKSRNRRHCGSGSSCSPPPPMTRRPCSTRWSEKDVSHPTTRVSNAKGRRDCSRATVQNRSRGGEPARTWGHTEAGCHRCACVKAWAHRESSIRIRQQAAKIWDGCEDWMVSAGRELKVPGGNLPRRAA
jgi:hypothetical protein